MYYSLVISKLQDIYLSLTNTAILSEVSPQTEPMSRNANGTGVYLCLKKLLTLFRNFVADSMQDTAPFLENSL